MGIFEKPPIYEGNEPYIFISYSHNSSGIVYDILWKLNDKGVRFWYDDGLKKGVDWTKHVEEKIKSSVVVWFFFDKNFFTSHSLFEEVKIVNENEIQYTPVFYEGSSMRKIYLNACEEEKNIVDGIEELYFNVFSPKITSFIKKEEHDFFDELILEANKINAVTDKIEIKKKQPAKTITFIGKKSFFTASIMEGIVKVFSEREDYKLESEYIYDNTYVTTEIQLLNILNKVLKKDCSGVIFRPIGKLDKKTFELFSELCKKTKVVLVDVDISKEQRNTLGSLAPVYVCSDFEKGGRKIGTVISQLSLLFGRESTDTFICVGPESNVPAKMRSNQIVNRLNDNHLNNVSILELDSLDPEDCLEKVTRFLKNRLSEQINDRCMLMYFGNDNVALYIAKHLDKIHNEKCKLTDYKKVVVMGYDGVKGITKNSILEESKYDYVTVDTIPMIQGETSAKTLVKVINGESVEKIIKVEPDLIQKISLPTMKESSLSPLKPLLEDCDLFIFDLDGTLADTETYHWKAYNVLMRERYGFELAEEDIKRYIGNSEVSIYRMIEKDYNIVIDTEKFLRDRLKIYLKLVHEENLQLFPWVSEFKNIAPNAPIMLLTSQVPEIVDYLLSFWGLDEMIPKNMRISAHDGKITKAEVFANPKKFANIEKSVDSVVVFEDSDHVAKLAMSFGHIVIGINHPYNKTTLKHATAIIDSTLKKGLFVGLGGVDIVYQTKFLPQENNKVKTKDYDITVGGPALNAAITCAKLGGSATLLTGIGNHPLGRLVKSICEQHGIRVVDIMPERKIPNISCVAVNLQDATRTIISGQKTDEQLNLPNMSFFRDFDYCLYDCNLPDISKKLVETLSKYDIKLVLDCGSWKDNIEYCLNYANIAISSAGFTSPNGKDIFDLSEMNDIEFVAKTRGGENILYSSKGVINEIEVHEKMNVNTLGAGDILHGAFCYYFFNCSNPFDVALKLASDYTTLTLSKKNQ